MAGCERLTKVNPRLAIRGFYNLAAKVSEVQLIGHRSLLIRVPAVGDNAAMEAEPPKRKRRWFQFSLRSLLIGVAILAVVCGYVGPHAKIVRERKAMVERILEVDGYIARDGPFAPIDHNESIPWIRRLLGDEAIVEVDLLACPLTAREINAVLPEAIINNFVLDPKTLHIKLARKVD